MSIDGYRKRRTVPFGDRHNIIIDERQPTLDVCCEINENHEWLMGRINATPSAESVATMLSRARTKILNDFKERIR